MAAVARTGRRRVIALVGGIADRIVRPTGTDAKVKRYASIKEGGAGELRRLLESIKRGGVDEVWILICWIGHSESKAIERESRKRGVHVERLGGPGQARKRTR